MQQNRPTVLFVDGSERLRADAFAELGCPLNGEIPQAGCFLGSGCVCGCARHIGSVTRDFYSVVRFILSSMRRPDPIKTPLLFCRHPGPRALTVAPSVRLSAGLLEGSGGSAVSRQVVGDNRQTTEENLLIPEFFSSTFAPLHTPSLTCCYRNRRGGDGEPAFPSWCSGRKGTWGKRSSYETTM